MQHNVAEERTHQVFSSPGVQQGHIQHHDVNSLVLGQHSPLDLNLLVVTPQPVNALDVKDVPRFQPAHHALVGRTVKVFTALFVDEYVFLRDV